MVRAGSSPVTESAISRSDIRYDLVCRREDCKPLSCRCKDHTKRYFHISK